MCPFFFLCALYCLFIYLFIRVSQHGIFRCNIIVFSTYLFQVFTVAGRDARISKETLKAAFERNVGHFKSGNYAMGLEGMIEMVVAAYSNAHIVQVPSAVGGFNSIFRIKKIRNTGEALWHKRFLYFSPPVETQPPPPPKNLPEPRPAPESVAPFRAAGLPNSVQHSKVLQPINEDEIEEKDKVWVSIMQQAVARCGAQPENLAVHVRAVVEEAMTISLKLISDERYNGIEEEVEAHKDVIGTRERAWESAKAQFVLPLYQKYHSMIVGSSQRTCPAVTLKNL
ncbi:unnamed protein product [Heligmosomoides polygyrus]|uniref:Rab3 GTPase-activating protein catalytic subunit n=1 Tax=Heligmosomoides polygyrus TaxID=6339 RepID=A0A183GHN0_HELPZ|nr:unnamed protein product [Heligmosomoides polygyrus]